MSCPECGQILKVHCENEDDAAGFEIWIDLECHACGREFVPEFEDEDEETWFS